LEYRAGLLAKGGSSRRLEDSEHHRTSKTITSRDGVSVSMHQSRMRVNVQFIPPQL
jgi:hypothetical protein